MRLLLDECVPHRLRHDLPGHEVRTVPDMGWTGKKNGDLLQAAEQHFDVLITVDRKLGYQQTIANRDIAVIVLAAPRIRIDFLRPLLDELERVLIQIRPGQLWQVGS